jgi:hypothetical protein
MDIERHYQKLAEWAVGVLNCHQLTTAILLGMTVGLQDRLMQQKVSGKALDISDLTQYECMKALCEKRKEEIEVFVNELNKLDVPLPEVDMDMANEAITNQYEKGHRLGMACDREALKGTMDKVMKGIDLNNPIPDDAT